MHCAVVNQTVLVRLSAVQQDRLHRFMAGNRAPLFNMARCANVIIIIIIIIIITIINYYYYYY